MGSIYVINKKKINQNRVTDNFYEIMIKRTREMLKKLEEIEKYKLISKYFLENRKNEENIN
jgi:hypothetical protein